MERCETCHDPAVLIVCPWCKSGFCPACSATHLAWAHGAQGVAG